MSESVQGEQQPLNLNVQTIPEGKKAELEAIWKLLEQATSLPVVGVFLKSKNLHFSAGSWAEMFEKRILPPVARGLLTVNDLASILVEAEQFGRCHVFLYKTSKEAAVRLLDDARIKSLCSKRNALPVLDGSVVWKTPMAPALSSIRKDAQSKTFGILETRMEREFIKEEVTDGIITRSWKQAEIRAVNSLRLHESGLLEVRIQSHSNSTKYATDIARIWKIVVDLLPNSEFREFSLVKAKRAICDGNETLKNKIRFSNSFLVNGAGTSMLASIGNDSDDLFTDVHATASIDKFLEGKGAYCDSANIWFLPVENIFDRQVHVLLSGQHNEFAVGADCTKAEYEHVLNELRLYSK